MDVDSENSCAAAASGFVGALVKMMALVVLSGWLAALLMMHIHAKQRQALSLFVPESDIDVVFDVWLYVTYS